MPNLSLTHVSSAELQEISSNLDLQRVFDGAQPVADCRKMHSFTYVSGILHTSELSMLLNMDPPEDMPDDMAAADTTPAVHAVPGIFITAVYDHRAYVGKVNAANETQA